MVDKMKSKIIIHNHSDLEDYDVMVYVTTVIKQGKISKTTNGEQYCFVTTFKGGITIYSSRRNNTYTFIVERRIEDDKSRQDTDA